MENINILCLGSQDMFPVKNNDCSHYIVNGHILVDCGTSPVMNLLNNGVDTTKIDTIIFTHLHNDHSVGLPSLLWYLRDVVKIDFPSLKIIGPKETVTGAVERVLLVVNAGKQTAPTPTVIPLSGGEKIILPDNGGELVLDTIKSQHAVPGICLKFTKNGKSVGFSGDTYSYPELSEFFLGCEALVYEASYGRRRPHETPEEVDESKRGCGHSCPIDAALVAAAANVQRVYLTHSHLDHASQVEVFKENSPLPVAFIKMGDEFRV